MPSPSEALNSIATGGFSNIPNNIVDTINNLLKSILPNNELWLVFGLSLVLAYRTKNKTNAGTFVFVIYILVIWSALRYWGIGG